MKQLFFLSIAVLFFFATCSPDKKSDHITIDLAAAINSTNSSLKSLNDISSDYRIIPLETNDSCLLSGINIKYVSDSDIWIKDNHIIYKLDKKTGMILFKLDKKGEGPGEYSTISDYVIDYKTRTIFIYDLRKMKIIKYNFDGKYLDSFNNDFIGSFDLIDEDYFLVSYSPFSKELFHIGVFDKNWNMLKQFMPKTNTAVQKSDVYHFDALYKFNGKYYVKKSFGDTIYQINKEHINPCFILSERDLKIPVQIATDLSKKKERSRYIYGESGYLISNYYFSSYYYQNMCYQDVWNLETSSLICRNLIKSQESRKGVPFFIEEKMIYVWPKFVAENYLYCIIPAEEIQAIIPNLQDDSNPCILEMKID